MLNKVTLLSKSQIKLGEKFSRKFLILNALVVVVVVLGFKVNCPPLGPGSMDGMPFVGGLS